jgi:hypothetical protein
MFYLQGMSMLDSNSPAGQPEMPGKQDTPLKKILPYTTAALVAALLYVAYIFYQRHEADVQAQAQIEAKQQADRERTLKAVFGDGEIRFTTFSIDTTSLRRGDIARLCYGVENATSVKLDPPIETLKPTYLHCLDISPKVTTKYTITAEDGKGHSKSESLELKVH